MAYYAVLLGGAVALWRWFPDQMRSLTRDLVGNLAAGAEPAGRRALEEAVTQPIFSGAWSGEMRSAAVAMIVAGLVALPVAWIYVLTRQKKGFRQSQVHTQVMLPVVVAGVVVLVKNNLALAFSLAGIVAAVRFRNTLEDSKDAVYIFVATGIGLAAGVALPVAVALSIIFNVVALLLWYSDLGRSSAALEGGIAERRLQQARAHANRPSGFIQRLDEEVLKAMSAEQLDVLAERAWRRRQRHAPDDGVDRDDFGWLLHIRATDVDAAMQATEALLGQYVKRWKFGSIVHESDGTALIEYAVHLKKSTIPAQLCEAVQGRGATAVVGVELRMAGG
jgi:hypothetical protein